MARVVLKKGHVKPIIYRHPWVFPHSIHHVEGEPVDGEPIEVVGPRKKFLARGLYNSQSGLSVRLWTWNEWESVDASLVRRRLDAAIRLRRETLNLEDRTNAYRVVHAEGDALPGLIVDKYADVLVVQISSLGLVRLLPAILEGLTDAFDPRAIIRRDDATMVEKEGLPVAPPLLAGTMPEETISIMEDGRIYEVDVRGGQKTGFYLDQRDNRRRIAGLAKGRRVFDGFSYTGGFAIACEAGGAEEIYAVESSTGPFETAKQNLARNECGDNVHLERDDVYKILNTLSDEQRYDLMILDPPKYAQRKQDRDKALKKYEELNHLAFQALAPDGLLLTCSCSHAIDWSRFESMLKRAAVDANRHVKVLERHDQAPDHPVAVTCPESRYLKAFLLHVE